jgi:RHS repeat-associated protein
MRSNKLGSHGETIYLNRWFSLRNGGVVSKHLFADDLRVSTKVTTNAEFLFFYQPDHLGSAEFVTDEQGSAYEHLEYFPSGEIWVDEHSDTLNTPFLFSGKELDDETGLSYFGYRSYEPRQGQWINPDPILDEMLDTGKLEAPDLSEGPFFQPGGVYVYAGNSPLTITDPNGLVAKLKKSRRMQYVGSTPGKSSASGRKVRNRMRAAGLLRDNPAGFEEVFVYSVALKKKSWLEVDSSIHMGHRVDAVRLWNGLGRYFGKKHKIVRAIMRDPDNYELEDGASNMSKGAKLGHTTQYEDVSPTVYDSVKNSPAKLSKWVVTFRKMRSKFLSKAEWNALKAHVPADAH